MRGVPTCCSLMGFLMLSSAITYLPEDGISSLEPTSLNATIAASNTAWVVEFFSHSCSHCISFAPTFTNFARNIKGWSGVVKVGAVTSEDRQFFLLHNVHKFPTIKFYLPWEMAGVKELEEGGVGVMEGGLLEALKQAALEGRGLQDWPQLSYVVDIEEMKEEAEGNKHLMHLLIVEDSSAQQAHLGELVIMDNSQVRKSVVISRSHIDIASQHNMSKRGLYLLMEQQFVLMPGIYNRTGLNEAVAGLANIHLNTTLNVTNVVNHYGSATLNYTVTDESYVYRPAHGLQAQDLLAGLRHTLWSEVAGARSIKGASMRALEDYVELLRRYLPLDDHVTAFLDSLQDRMRARDNFTSQQWLDTLNSLETDLAYVPSSVGWQGCRGSRDHLRGYPCSVWMSFHAITVGAFKCQRGHSNKTGLQNLLVIRNYMEHFFSCEQCRLHFLRHTSSWPRELLNPDSVWTEKRAVLTLWKLHNAVNQRLHREPLTEDPRHPKIQFPAREDCLQCRRRVSENYTVFHFEDSDWNVEEVFQYLVDYYDHAQSSSCKDKGQKVVMTPWSACSRSCDSGVSVRMSSNNSECALRLQTRLCVDKPCSLTLPQAQDCSTSGRMYKLAHALHLSILNCTSEALHDWTVCGRCQNEAGRPVCCRPSATSNKQVRMTCDQVRASRVDDDGGVWLNRWQDGASKVASKMEVRVVEMCSCSEEFC